MRTIQTWRTVVWFSLLSVFTAVFTTTVPAQANSLAECLNAMQMREEAAAQRLAERLKHWVPDPHAQPFFVGSCGSNGQPLCPSDAEFERELRKGLLEL